MGCTSKSGDGATLEVHVALQGKVTTNCGSGLITVSYRGCMQGTYPFGSALTSFKSCCKVA